MNTYISEKLKIASLFATILVVIRHAANWVAFFHGSVAPEWLMNFEWGTLFMTDVAVPYFFMASGFFFMRYDYIEEGFYWSMLNRKFRTLFVPFVIWNIFGACVLLIYDSEGHLGHTPLECMINFVTSQWYGPLWFVRDIMILMVLYPVYGWMYKRYCQPLMILLILFLIYYMWYPGGTDFLTGEGLTFFFLGGLIQKHSSILERKFPVWIGVLLFFGWIFVSFFISSWQWEIHRICVLFELLAFWISLDLLPKSFVPFFIRISSFSFFIYVSHFYLHKIFKIFIALLFPEDAIAALFAFIIIPIVTIILIIIVGRFWKKIHISSYNICMGNR